MKTHVAWLRAVNVGGTGKLSMARLVEVATELGLADARTYIQSGNLVFRSKLAPAKIKGQLQAALSEELGKPAAISLRSAADLEGCLANNRFKSAKPQSVIVMFYEDAPTRAQLEAAALSARAGEELVLQGRDLYVHYPAGQGTSKLKVPTPSSCTGRNINTIEKVLVIARAMQA